MSYEIQSRRCVRKVNGRYVRFRSVLEARWSLVFDALHLDWEYEPETFVLQSGRLYTPDFRIGSNWIEIKPTFEALLDVEGKLHDFAQTGIPDGGRFFSFTSNHPAFSYAGKSTVVEWTAAGVCRRSNAHVIFCADNGCRRDYPDLYADYVGRVFEQVRYASVHGPTPISLLLEL